MKKFFHIVLLMFCIGLSYAKPLIVLDAGHQPSQPGAISVCGKNEFQYNDEITELLKNVLNENYRIRLTREKDKNIKIEKLFFSQESTKLSSSSKQSLFERAMIANSSHADIFIAIHHDSVPARYQINNPLACNGHSGREITNEFKKKFQIGYTIFINDRDRNMPKKVDSALLAKEIAIQLQKIGRYPSDYHIYPIDDCKSCYPINQKLGIWHQNLVVLRETYMPAVLIEVGNIVDVADNRIISNQIFKEKFSHAIKTAIDNYFLAKKTQISS